MGKEDNNLLFIGVIVIVGLLAFNYYKAPIEQEIPSPIVEQQPVLQQPQVEDVTINIYGTDLYFGGTVTSNKGARVFMNGEQKGNFSLLSSTTYAQPNQPYKIYLGYNDEGSPIYYTRKVTGTTPNKGTLDISEGLAKIDTNPNIYYKNNNLQTNTALAIDAAGNHLARIVIEGQCDYAYGNPSTSKGNAMCFLRTNSEISSVKLSGAPLISIPSIISSSTITSGRSISCYEFPKVADCGRYEGSVEITAATDAIDDIAVMIKDVGLTQHRTTLEDIEGYTDEEGNILGGLNYKNTTISIT